MLPFLVTPCLVVAVQPCMERIPTKKKCCDTDQKETCLVLKPQKNLCDLFNEFNNFSDQNKNQENISNCNLNEIKPLSKLNKSSCSLFHLNTYSLSNHFEDLEYLLDSTNFNFDVIAISETRICYKDVYVNSFFPCTARLWNSLPIECFPLTYDLSGFKSRINRYLLIVGSN